MSYHFQRVSKSDKFHTRFDDRAFYNGGLEPSPFVSVDGWKVIQFSFLISTELIALDTDCQHYLDISPVLRFERPQKPREILPRLHSGRDNDVKWRHRLPISPPATFLSASHATPLGSVCRFSTRVPTNETVCSAIHSQINYWQKWNGEWKRDP